MFKGQHNATTQKPLATLNKIIMHIPCEIFSTRVASFAKFREMQKTILRKIFRENWVRKTAKIVTAEFDPFRAQIGVK